MRLRSTLALVLLCATSLSLVAQQKERVLPVITTGKDATWYAQQYKLWDKEVK
jgi:ABC-type sugar transport system substrate-binding protein